MLISLLEQLEDEMFDITKQKTLFGYDRQHKFHGNEMKFRENFEDKTKSIRIDNQGRGGSNWNLQFVNLQVLLEIQYWF